MDNFTHKHNQKDEIPGCVQSDALKNVLFSNKEFVFTFL
jgi:hypothetical protein